MPLTFNGRWKKVAVRRDGDLVQVRDYGRGIPLGKVVDRIENDHRWQRCSSVLGWFECRYQGGERPSTCCNPYVMVQDGPLRSR